ncbi:choice-of-anchor M domain-containing protein [Rothia sp. P13129]|uniref:choice-of-anchor M domain-containing protein n=1 Tax=unclassified Rothia (in: high G+C Gram-positive bacteria) TaxID=2689056 RepID=UPI003ABFABCC
MKKFPRLTAAVCTLLFLGSGTSIAPAMADETGTEHHDANVSVQERALEQTLSADSPIGTEKTVIPQGHVDMGPKFVDGQWRLMLHDDHGQSPVWRHLSDVVLQGNDDAKLPVPDDPRYAFVQASAGEDVYVIPQTERSGVVWPGWNSQDPEVVSRLGEGMTLTLEKVEGPGQMSLYLENGNFSAPQVLWNSADTQAQDIWVDSNSHVHANWVFTKPGAYFVTVKAHATLADGTKVSDTARLQFAVGSALNPQEVFAQAESKPEDSSDSDSVQSAPSSDTSTDSTQNTSAQDAQDAGSSLLPIALFVGVGAVLIVALYFFSRKSKRAQQEAQERLR